MRLIVDGDLDGARNMAEDTRLLEAAELGEAAARVYGWHGPWVSLGRFQKPEQALMTPSSTPWVSRPTGGKAVLHGHDVTVAMAIPLEAIGATSKSLRQAYRWAAAPLIAALNGCGVPAALAEETRWAHRGPRTADCFAFCSPNDIVHAQLGLKLCGCALRLTERAVLIQASIPNGAPLLPPTTVIREAAAPSGYVWDSSRFPGALRTALESATIAKCASASSTRA